MCSLFSQRRTPHCHTETAVTHSPSVRSGVKDRRTTSTNTPDDTTLVLVVSLHVEVTVVCYGKYVRRHLADLLIGVEADLVRGVDGQQLVGIDGHQD